MLFFKELVEKSKGGFVETTKYNGKKFDSRIVLEGIEPTFFALNGCIAILLLQGQRRFRIAYLFSNGDMKII